MSDKVVPIRKAIDDAKPVKKKAVAEDGGKKKGADKPPPTDPPEPPIGGFFGPPEILPDDCLVKALGRQGSMYYFLDCKGQLEAMEAAQIGRMKIISLFGGTRYLIATWPAYTRDGQPRTDEFKHGLVGPMLVKSCSDKPLFDPKERVRRHGAWVEEDGSLVFHCGDILHVVSQHGDHSRRGTGLRNGLLYPAAKRTPEPILDAQDDAYGAAATLYKKLCTWNWSRGETDAKLMFGWICAALLAAAQPWRPMIWVTGTAGSGKSSLSKLVEWTLGGIDSVIKSENATPASIFQLVGQSSLPVVLDEVEAKANNKRTHEVIELARLAASGGALTRGGADGTPLNFVARNCFFFSSILIPPLKSQDVSRMAILNLDKIEWEGASKRDETPDPDAEDEILGRQRDWVRVGRELRGGLIRAWPRYKLTFAAYRRALASKGHDARGADQFGALGAAYDCVMYDGFSDAHAQTWAAALPAAELAEIRARQSTEAACLSHLLSAPVDVHRGGKKQTVGHWLQEARNAKLHKDTANRNEADEVLKGCGIVLYRDARDANPDARKRLWWIAVSNTHQEVARIFNGTDWSGDAGVTGTWAQAISRLPDAANVRLRINKVRHYMTAIPWEGAFPADDKTGADRDWHELVAAEDREDD